MTERAFDFLPTNPRGEKPRSRGLTEIRGPYYSPVGAHYLEDLLRAFGAYVDSLKFAGGSFAIMPRAAVVDFPELLRQVESGRIKAAIDVFPAEPVPADHPVRKLRGAVLSAHRTGGMPEALFQIGRMTVADAELIELAGLCGEVVGEGQAMPLLDSLMSRVMFPVAPNLRPPRLPAKFGGP